MVEAFWVTVANGFFITGSKNLGWIRLLQFCIFSGIAGEFGPRKINPAICFKLYCLEKELSYECSITHTQTRAHTEEEEEEELTYHNVVVTSHAPSPS